MSGAGNGDIAGLGMGPGWECPTCGRGCEPYNGSWMHVCMGIDMREIDKKPLAERLRFAADYAIPDWLKPKDQS